MPSGAILGVRGIYNEIRLRPRIPTAHIAREIGRAFQRNAQLDANTIDVSA